MSGSRVFGRALGAVVGLLALGVGPTAAADDGIAYFETHVRPVLVARCYGCHSETAGKRKGGLTLDTREGLRRGGLSGPALVPGDAASSLLMKAVRHEDDLEMPPDERLPAYEVAALARWVAMGAPDPRDERTTGQGPRQALANDLWSLRPVSDPPPPAVKDARWPLGDLDRFVLSALESQGFGPAPTADRATWLRRVHHDLTGLPPSHHETRAFLADRAPEAPARVVDRLLASPHYGERWARLWLDVARYADTKGPLGRLPYAWSYRDWVVRAFNDDMPYDRFVVAQLAADLIPGGARGDLAALGFLTVGRHNLLDTPQDRIDDRIDVVGRGLLGLTVGCARCHNHKHDPVSIKDYYALYGVFASTREPDELPLLDPAAGEADAERTYARALRERREAIESFTRKRHEERKADLRKPETLARYLCAALEALAARGARAGGDPALETLSKERDVNLLVLRRWRDHLATRGPDDAVFGAFQAEAARAASASARAPVCRRMADRLAAHDGRDPRPAAVAELHRQALRGPDAPTEVPLERAEELQSEGDKNHLRGLRRRLDALVADHAFGGGAARAMAVEDLPRPIDARVLLRGNPNTPGEVVPRRFLAALSREPAPFTAGSGRLALARAIVHPDNPLTARVMVNRVWQHLFGAGLVRTPSDFGTRGDAPTHPALLDYLARRFVEDGWSVKRLVRTIVLSRTYQQSSHASAGARSRDPENRLLSRMNRRRRDAESLRDAFLVAAGVLDRTLGGVPVSLTALPGSGRRTLYGFVDRARLAPVLRAFDFADPEQHAPRRHVTTIPQQALFLLNSPFLADMARRLAARPEVAGARGDDARIRALYRAALAREPEPDELTAGRRFVAQGRREPVAPSTDDWAYGTARVEAGGARLARFERLPAFADDAWQTAGLLPDPRRGSARLTATGGTPGRGPDSAVVRRLVLPCGGRLTVTGTLEHRKTDQGDGVVGHVVSSRRGLLASYVVKGSQATTALEGLAARAGEILDFVVDGGADAEADDFQWAPRVSVAATSDKATGGCRETRILDAAKDFRGPTPVRLSTWERYAQVLLLTHELAFVD